MMLKRTVILLSINLAVFCVCAEILGLVVYYYQHGWLFYANPYRQTYEVISDQARGQAFTNIGLSPYFGPIHRAGSALDIPAALRETPASPSRVEANNFGFASPHAYPFARTGGDQLVVGIFGGSVAAWFCQVGVSRLEATLKQNPFFARRTLVPLCFSHEGYKQPQQLLTLAYFLSVGQQFDLVINIDGFNEVALSPLNEQHGWDISMPSVMHLDPLINLVNQSTLTSEKLDSLAAIGRDKRRLNALAARLNRNRFASIDFVLGRYYAFVERRYREELVRFDQLPSNPPQQSVIHVAPPVRDRRGTNVYEDIAREWIASSLLMKQLLTARGVPYFHVLQPNQYYSTRTFSAAEAKVAFNAGSPFKEGAARGYPFLEMALQSSGGAPDVLNAVHVFDAERAAVYIDDCCHYTLVGNQRLADFIAKSILASTGPWTGEVRLKVDTTDRP
jgi:hypothetical protein